MSFEYGFIMAIGISVVSDPAHAVGWYTSSVYFFLYF
jgi:hypothetical protein